MYVIYPALSSAAKDAEIQRRGMRQVKYRVIGSSVAGPVEHIVVHIDQAD